MKRASLIRWLVLILLVGIGGMFAYDHLFVDQGPVQATRLEWQWPLRSIFGAGYKNTSFALDAQQQNAMKVCRLLTNRYRTYKDGVCLFDEDSTKEELEALLVELPDFFYVEYLLGLWHKRHGNAKEHEAYMQRAFAHAPVVLVQPYVLKDGMPLRDVTIDEFRIACCQVQNRKLDYVDLEFFELTTDSDGTVRVPVFATSYCRSTISLPLGYRTIYPPLGFFKSTKHIGILPAAIATPCEKE